MLLCCILALMSSCREDNVLFRISDRLTVSNSVSCHCNTLTLHEDDGSKTVLLEEVLVVMGNADKFLVQYLPPNAYSAEWKLVNSDNVYSAENLIVLSDNEIDKTLETLKIDFVKDYTE